MAETIVKSTAGNTLVDVLSLVLDKGIVIAGDIQIKLADVDLLTIKIRLLICGVDKAKELGIDWWERDPYISSKAKGEENEGAQEKNKKMRGKTQVKMKLEHK